TSLPSVPLLTLGVACIGLSRMLTQRESQAAGIAASQDEKDKQAKTTEQRVEDSLTVDPMEIELGVGLIRLADPNRGGDLLDRVQRVRQNIGGEIGILMPKVRIRDNMRLEATAYRIKIADIPVAQAEIQPTQLLAIYSGMTTGKVDGIATKDPAFGSEARWINPGLADQAELYVYTVVEPGAVLATHLTETCRRHADEIV